MKILLIFIFGINFVFCSGWGSSGGAFLRIDAAADAAARGSAFLAQAKNAAAIFYNPAGIKLSDYHNFYLMHTEYLPRLGIASQYFAHCHKLKRFDLAAGLIYLHTQDTERDQQANEKDEFNNSSLALTVALADVIEKKGKLYWGAAAKIITEKLHRYQATSVAFDGGIIYQPWFLDNLKFAGCIQNLGLPLLHRKEASPLPLDLKFGCGYEHGLFKNKKYKGTLSVGLDLIFHLIEQKSRVNLGFEYKLLDTFSFRFGFPNIFGDNKLYFVSLGFGIKVFDYLFDYAYLPWEYFGNSHRFCLNVTFPRPIEYVAPPPPLKELFKITCRPEVALAIEGRGLKFLIDAWTHFPAKDWTLIIADKEFKAIRTYSAKGMPPKEIIWDGKDEKGNVVKVGEYLYAFTLTDQMGNECHVPYGYFEVIPEIEKIEEPEIISFRLLGEVLFEKGKAELTKLAYKVLDQIAIELKKHLDKKIMIEGHTCDLPLIGKAAEVYKDNFSLSKARAESVREYLISLGIPAENIRTFGWGPLRPIYPNDKEENRMKNRRVEIIILKE